MEQARKVIILTVIVYIHNFNVIPVSPRSIYDLRKVVDLGHYELA